MDSSKHLEEAKQDGEEFRLPDVDNEKIFELIADQLT